MYRKETLRFTLGVEDRGELSVAVVGGPRCVAPPDQRSSYGARISDRSEGSDDPRQERAIGTDEERVSIISWASKDGSASGS